MPRTLLADDELATALARLPAWRRDGAAMVRTLVAPSFLDAVRLVDRVARVAEAQDHHPDIHLSWKTLTLRLSTHDAGGVTAADVELALALDPLLDAVAP